MGFLTAAPCAFAEATRTWVSGIGDDANPCSRTAPCKTFAGAISKTAAGGEIDALDPGGFGAVTITKSITINGRGTHAAILNSGGTNGVIVNDSATASPGTIVVNLVHLSINGVGSGANGVRVVNGKIVRLEDVSISGETQRGIAWDSTASGKLFVNNSQIHDNGDRGISFQPGSGGGQATITNTLLENNTNGAGLTASGATGTTKVFVRNVTSAGNKKGFVAESNAKMNIDSCLATDNTVVGITADTSGIARVSNSTIVGNVLGVSATNGGQTLSRLNNTLQDNTTDGSFSGSYGAS